MIGREGLHRQVLLDLFSDAGATAPRSYISTGNISFSAASGAIGQIVETVEQGIEAVIGRREEVYVRSMESLVDLVASTPFTAAPYSDVVERTVTFIPPDTDLRGFEVPIESPSGRVCVFAATEHEILSAGRSVDGRTQGAGGFVERLLGSRVTSRAWSTIERIVNNPT